MKRQFGRYQLLYRFASGGMAALYLGRLSGADGFEKRVAVKVIHEHLTDHPQFVKMFIDEARLASLIVHPNVAQILELGRVGKTHFIAMEYVEGESVISILKRALPPVRIACRIVADAAAGLHAAHELRDEEGELRHVVHRDVSPQNILVSYKGATKVVDFGVARARGGLHTTDGRRKGKLSYMAPEQLTDYDSIDRRSDVFALGVVLYEMTTGRRLFGGDTEAVQISKVLHSEITPPSSFAQDFPAELEQIVMRALSRDPQERFQTSQELQVALERFIAGSGDPVLQSEVGELMSELFAHRIEQKKKLLTMAGSTQDSSVPGLELQHQTEGGVVTRLEAFIDGIRPAEQAGGSASTPSIPKRRRNLLALIGASVLVVALAAGITAMVIREGSSTSASVPDARIDVDGGAPPARARGADGRAGTIAISVRASPRRAKILLDGKRVSNPLEIRRPAGQGHAEVKVVARGYRPQRIEVPLDKGGTWVVNLRRRGARPIVREKQKKGAKKKGKKGKLGDDDVLESPYER